VRHTLGATRPLIAWWRGAVRFLREHHHSARVAHWPMLRVRRGRDLSTRPLGRMLGSGGLGRGQRGPIRHVDIWLCASDTIARTIREMCTCAAGCHQDCADCAWLQLAPALRATGRVFPGSRVNQRKRGYYDQGGGKMVATPIAYSERLQAIADDQAGTENRPSRGHNQRNQHLVAVGG
jgi:hypothetical protein